MIITRRQLRRLIQEEAGRLEENYQTTGEVGSFDYQVRTDWDEHRGFWMSSKQDRGSEESFSRFEDVVNWLNSLPPDAVIASGFSYGQHEDEVGFLPSMSPAEAIEHAKKVKEEVKNMWSL